MFFCIKIDPFLHRWGNAKTPHPKKRLITRIDAHQRARSCDVGQPCCQAPRAPALGSLFVSLSRKSLAALSQ